MTSLAEAQPTPTCAARASECAVTQCNAGPGRHARRRARAGPGPARHPARAHLALLVADDDHRAEAHLLAALHHLGHAADLHHALLKLLLALLPAALPAVLAVPAAPAAPAAPLPRLPLVLVRDAQVCQVRRRGDRARGRAAPARARPPGRGARARRQPTRPAAATGCRLAGRLQARRGVQRSERHRTLGLALGEWLLELDAEDVPYVRA